MNNKIDTQTNIIITRKNKKESKRKIKNNKPHRFSIGLLIKILFPTLIIITAIVLSISLYSYNMQKKNIVNDATKTIKVISHVTATMLDSSDFTNIRREDDITNSSYSKIFNTLTYINSNNVVKYIYTLYFFNGEIFYGVDTDPNIPTRYIPGDPYRCNSKEEYEHIINGKHYTSTTISYRNNLPIITSIAPIFSANGHLVGAVGCDYSLEPAFNNLNTTFSKSILITFIAIVISSLIISYVIHIVVIHVRTIQRHISDT